MIRTINGIVLALLAASCVSKPADSERPVSGPLPESDAQIGYDTPDQALRALRNKPGVEVTVQQGWTIAEDRSEENFALWSFTPDGHPAHPTVVKRIVYEEKGHVWIRMGTICGGPKETCDRLVREFEELNERLKQSMQHPNP